MKRIRVEGQTFDKPGRALDLEKYDEIIITGNRFINCGGIFIQAKPRSLIRVIGNVAENMRRAKGMEYAQFLQISGLDADGDPVDGVIIDCQIEKNIVTNRKGECDVEDNINLIGVQGTKDKRIIVRDNQITGAWPRDLSDKALEDYSGGGIICDRGTHWAYITGNRITETTNYGIAIAGGCDNMVVNNSVWAKNAINVGIYCWNAYSHDPFERNRVQKNKVRWMTKKGRNDYWLPDAQ